MLTFNKNYDSRKVKRSGGHFVVRVGVPQLNVAISITVVVHFVVVASSWPEAS